MEVDGKPSMGMPPPVATVRCCVYCPGRSVRGKGVYVLRPADAQKRKKNFLGRGLPEERITWGCSGKGCLGAMCIRIKLKSRSPGEGVPRGGEYIRVLRWVFW